MALGKRKREVTVVQRSPRTKIALDEHSFKPQSNAHEVFQHYFESHFEPLTDLTLSKRSLEEQEEYDYQQDGSGGESETSEWDGISDAETASGAVEVIKHEPVTGTEDAGDNRIEVKTFMVSYVATHFCTSQI
jgi:hypothetical protein